MDLATLIQPVNLFLALVAGLSVYLVYNSLTSVSRVPLGRHMAVSYTHLTLPTN